MPLTVIKGPPNSGRTELVREMFESRIVDDPVLVVPSTDDIFGWERRLTRARGAFIGGRVAHFKDLVDQILGDSDSIASPLRRRALATEALHDGWPAVARRLGDQPGLVDAALRTIDEFRESLIGPETFDDTDIADAVGPMADVYRCYVEGLEGNGLTDLPARTSKAATRSLDEWEGRPVFIAGFDDLTKQQLELLRRLSLKTDVVIAITHERGNQAMAVTEGLLGSLEAIGATVAKETSRPEEAPDHAALLVKLERAFLDTERAGTLSPGKALTLIEASGRRGESEAIGAEIARLIDDGTDPGQIAVAIESPATNGRVILDLLTEYEIPATLEAETKAPETATGQAVIDLLKAGSRDGTADRFLKWLRGPLGLDPTLIDEVEFLSVRGGAESAIEVARIAEERGLRLGLSGWKQLAEGDPAGAAKTVATLSAATLTGNNPDSLPGAAVATETQMATAICRAVDELSGFREETLTVEMLVEALSSGAVKTWAVPLAHTVQIASPYSMRAKRAQYLFIASLQEKDLGTDEGGPLISRQARDALAMPELTDQEQQESYLFYSCLAVPTHGLWLSHRVADVHGKAEIPSPMIGEVKRLFKDDGAGLKLIRRSSSDIVFPPDSAPAIHEWALSQAALEETPDTGTETGPATEVARAISRAKEIQASTDTLTDLDSPATLAGLSGRNIFSATALEAFIECPYRWFFERAMSPTRFGPEPEALAKGNLIHIVLAELYGAHPEALPTRIDVGEWIAEMEALVTRFSDSCDLGGDSARHQIQRRQVAAEMTRFLRREATREATSFRPIDLETKFGFGDDGSMPPLEGEGWLLRGVIDRIDRDPEGNGVVIDYKSGPSAYKTLAEMQREGKVQLHLYLKALEQHWGLDPIAGLYVPVFAAKSKSRGMVDEAKYALISDMGLVSGDRTPDLAAEIEAGFERANLAATKILRGEIAHDPAECLNHFAHAGVPDWQPEAMAENGGSDR